MSAILAALVNGAILGAAVTAIVWLVLRLMPRRVFNAATRYMVWWATLAVVVLLPVWSLPIHFGSFEPPAAAYTAAPVEVSAPVTETPMPITTDVTPVEIAPLSRLPRFPIELPAGFWPTRILTAWAFITLLMLARLAASCALLERRKARASAAPANLTAHLNDWLTLCAATRKRVRLAVSSEITTPMAAGPRRPSILIPARLFDELDEGEIDQIGLHETAHLARGDDYALIVQRVLEAVFALHPLVRWITRRIELEREIACDDFVIEATGRARPYAVCLTRVVELTGGVRASLAAAAATEERSHLARRVEMLLDKTRHTGTRLLKARLTAVVAALIALSWMAAKTPGLVAFAMPAGDTFLDTVGDPQGPEPPQPPVPANPPAPARAPEPPVPPRTPTRSWTSFATPAPPAPFASDAPLAPEPPTPPPAFSETPVAVESPTPWPPQPPTPPASPRPAAAPEAPEAPAPASGHYSLHSSSDGEHNMDWHWRDGLNSRDVRLQGDVEFNDDESDVKSMSPGSWFSIEESHGFAGRRFQAAADGSGQITRRYLVDGRETTLDDQGRAWLRSTIPEMLRDTGFDAPARVRRILRHGGVPAVLTEIGKIHGSGSRRRYIQELVPIGNLNADQFQTVLRFIREMGSDGDKASLLISIARPVLKDNLRDFAFEAVSTIRSSGDKRRVLASFAQEDPSRATLAAVARSCESIQSDGDKASLLVELAAHFRGNEDMRRPYFRATESIHSSGDRARVLIAVIGSAGDHHETLVDALRATAGIPSDGDKARVLVHASGYWKDDDAVRHAYFDAANAVNSSGDHARVLTAVLGRDSLTTATLIEGVRSAGHIQSDGDKTRVLMMVIQRPDANNEVLIAAIQAAARVASDGDKGRLLVEAAQRASGKAAVRTEIRNAVRSLHSDGEYRRVMSILDKETAI